MGVISVPVQASNHNVIGLMSIRNYCPGPLLDEKFIILISIIVIAISSSILIRNDEIRANYFAASTNKNVKLSMQQ